MTTVIYTGQIGKLPNNVRSACIIDSTVKTGCVEVAPTWDIVMGVKEYKACCQRGVPLTPTCVSIDDYKRIYKQMLMDSFVKNEVFFTNLLKEPTVVFTCYCNLKTPGIKFCHRVELAKEIWEYFSPLGYDIVLGGELN